MANTILTNKAAKTETVIDVLQKTHVNLSKKVREIALDMAASMELIAKKAFPNATRVTDYASRTVFMYKN